MREAKGGEGVFLRFSLTLNRGAQHGFLLNENTFQAAYTEYFWISRNTFKAALEDLYLFGHPWATWVFSSYKGFNIIFPKILDAI